MPPKKDHAINSNLSLNSIANDDIDDLHELTPVIRVGGGGTTSYRPLVLENIDYDSKPTHHTSSGVNATILEANSFQDRVGKLIEHESLLHNLLMRCSKLRQSIKSTLDSIRLYVSKQLPQLTVHPLEVHINQSRSDHGVDSVNDLATRWYTTLLDLFEYIYTLLLPMNDIVTLTSFPGLNLDQSDIAAILSIASDSDRPGIMQITPEYINHQVIGGVKGARSLESIQALTRHHTLTRMVDLLPQTVPVLMCINILLSVLQRIPRESPQVRDVSIIPNDAALMDEIPREWYKHLSDDTVHPSSTIDHEDKSFSQYISTLLPDLKSLFIIPPPHLAPSVSPDGTSPRLADLFDYLYTCDPSTLQHVTKSTQTPFNTLPFQWPAKIAHQMKLLSSMLYSWIHVASAIHLGKHYIYQQYHKIEDSSSIPMVSNATTHYPSHHPHPQEESFHPHSSQPHPSQHQQQHQHQHLSNDSPLPSSSPPPAAVLHINQIPHTTPAPHVNKPGVGVSSGHTSSHQSTDSDLGSSDSEDTTDSDGSSGSGDNDDSDSDSDSSNDSDSSSEDGSSRHRKQQQQQPSSSRKRSLLGQSPRTQRTRRLLPTRSEQPYDINNNDDDNDDDDDIDRFNNDSDSDSDQSNNDNDENALVTQSPKALFKQYDDLSRKYFRTIPLNIHDCMFYDQKMVMLFPTLPPFEQTIVKSTLSHRYSSPLSSSDNEMHHFIERKRYHDAWETTREMVEKVINDDHRLSRVYIPLNIIPQPQPQSQQQQEQQEQQQQPQEGHSEQQQQQESSSSTTNNSTTTTTDLEHVFQTARTTLNALTPLAHSPSTPTDEDGPISLSDGDVQLASSPQPLYISGIVFDRLLPHQQKAVQWLSYKILNHSGAILADEMGLGKSVQISALLSAFDYSFRLGYHTSPLTTLLVVPASIIGLWLHEIHIWVPSMRVFTWIPTAHPHNIGDSNSIPTSSLSLTKMRKQMLYTCMQNQSPSVLIVSYSTLQSPIFEAFSSTFKWNLVVLDECQRVSNEQTITHRKCLELNAMSHILLTGTPIQNSLKDLWSLMSVARIPHPGSFSMINDAIKKLRTEEDVRIAINICQLIRQHIASHILRRTKDKTVTLPPQTHSLVMCTMEYSQCMIYNKLITNIRSETMTKTGKHRRSGNTFRYLGSLLRICTHPDLVVPPEQQFPRYYQRQRRADEMGSSGMYMTSEQRCRLIIRQSKCGVVGGYYTPDGDVNEYVPGIQPAAGTTTTTTTTTSSSSSSGTSTAYHQLDEPQSITDTCPCLYEVPLQEYGCYRRSGKLDSVLRLICSWLCQGDKVTVFSSSVKALDMVCRHLRCQWLRIDGSTPPLQRTQITSLFNNGVARILLASTKCVGEGVTLTNTDKVVLLNCSWNPASDAQCISRTHRLGRTKPCAVYTTIVKGSLESYVIHTQHRKMVITNAILKGSKSMNQQAIAKGMGRGLSYYIQPYMTDELKAEQYRRDGMPRSDPTLDDPRHIVHLDNPGGEHEVGGFQHVKPIDRHTTRSSHQQQRLHGMRRQPPSFNIIDGSNTALSHLTAGLQNTQSTRKKGHGDDDTGDDSDDDDVLGVTATTPLSTTTPPQHLSTEQAVLWDFYQQQIDAEKEQQEHQRSSALSALSRYGAIDPDDPYEAAINEQLEKQLGETRNKRKKHDPSSSFDVFSRVLADFSTDHTAPVPPQFNSNQSIQARIEDEIRRAGAAHSHASSSSSSTPRQYIPQPDPPLNSRGAFTSMHQPTKTHRGMTPPPSSSSSQNQQQPPQPRRSKPLSQTLNQSIFAFGAASSRPLKPAITIPTKRKQPHQPPRTQPKAKMGITGGESDEKSPLHRKSNSNQPKPRSAMQSSNHQQQQQSRQQQQQQQQPRQQQQQQQQSQPQSTPSPAVNDSQTQDDSGLHPFFNSFTFSKTY